MAASCGGAGLIIILLFAAAYAWLVMPRYSALKQMEQTVQSEKKVLAALKQKQALSTEKTAETVAALQKKVPVYPLTDQLLLLFQKAEYVADSQLVSVQFSNEGLSLRHRTAMARAAEEKERKPHRLRAAFSPSPPN
ncbi:hypothetical protein LR69_00208 [Geobacillus sp. BCO2]|nr:hypothetical protein LR69_00208 [Geobacillus sp. BCO2]